MCFCSGTILGFKPDQAKNSVDGNARLAVIRGHAARQTYRGVISLPKVVELERLIPTQAPSSSKAAATTKPLPASLPEKPQTQEVVAAAAVSSAEQEAVGSKRKRAAEQEPAKRTKK